MAKLFLVPTPVGNLADFTYRAVEVLNQVNLILAEDTRTSSKLLQHYGIKTPCRAYHQFNEHKVCEQIIGLLQQGQDLAVITDAGTPGISDPGFLLVRACVENDIEVECLPGATAFVPALVQSGFPCERFIFEGFLPQKKGRATRLATLAAEPRTMVFYESPYRVVRTLQQFMETFGPDRRCAVCREISKIHEESVRGTLREVAAHFTEHEPRGEFVIVVEGATRRAAAPTPNNPTSFIDIQTD